MPTSTIHTHPDPALMAELARLADGAAAELPDRARADQRSRWLAGQRIGAELYIAALPDLPDPADMILGEWHLRRELGGSPSLEEYRHRFPDHVEALRELAGRTDTNHYFASEVTDTSDFQPPSSEDVAVVESKPLETIGPFELRRKLGEGGMGTVYEAYDTTLRRTDALKVLKPHLASRPKARKRFLREARAMAKLDHERIVRVYRADEEDGKPFLVMPLLPGETLDARLKRDGKLPVTEVVRLAHQMAEGLAVAHEAGLIHRDVKPSNVWLKPGADGTPNVVLLDFGLARAQHTDDTSSISEQGAAMGTVGYMSPEQARGEEVDSRTDLFSLGCVLFEMCCGHRPFRGHDGWSTMRAVLQGTPPKVGDAEPGLPGELAGVIDALLAHDPAERPGSARAVMQALGVIDGGASEGTPAAGTPTGSSRFWWLLAAVALALTAGLVALFAL